jgi:hypothetical protein
MTACGSCGCSGSAAVTSSTNHLLKFSGILENESESSINYLSDNANVLDGAITVRVPYVAPAPMRFKHASVTFTQGSTNSTFDILKNGNVVASMTTLSSDPNLTPHYVDFNTLWAKGDILEIRVTTSTVTDVPIPLCTVVLSS